MMECPVSTTHRMHCGSSTRGIKDALRANTVPVSHTHDDTYSFVFNTDRKVQRSLSVYMPTGEQLTALSWISDRSCSLTGRWASLTVRNMNTDTQSFTKGKLWQLFIFLCLRLKVELLFMLLGLKWDESE